MSAVAILPKLPTPSSASTMSNEVVGRTLYYIILPVPILFRLGLKDRLLSVGLIFLISLSNESGEMYSKTRDTLLLNPVVGGLPGRGPTGE